MSIGKLGHLISIVTFISHLIQDMSLEEMLGRETLRCIIITFNKKEKIEELAGKSEDFSSQLKTVIAMSNN